MDFLSSFYQKAKKKLQDWEQPIQRSVSSGLGQAYNNAKSYLGDAGNYVAPKIQSFNDNYTKPAEDFFQKNPTPYSYVAPKVKNYFNNDATVGGVTKNTILGIPKASREVFDKGPADALVNSSPYLKKHTGVSTALYFPEELSKNMLQGMTKVFSDGPKIIGEGLAYATDKNVRDQYQKGNLDILPTVSKTTAPQMLANTGQAALEAVMLGSGAPNPVSAGEKKLADYVTSKIPNIKRVSPAIKESIYGLIKNVPQGYAWDVLGRVGQGETGPGVFKPGLGTAITALHASVPAGNELAASIKSDLNRLRGKEIPESIPAHVVHTNERPSYDGKSTYFTPKELPAQEAPYKTPQFFRDVNSILPKPGMTIEESPKLAQKRAQAKAIVTKQIENQKAGLPQAEPGFVAPGDVVSPKPKVPLPSIEEYVNGPTKAEQKPAMPNIEEFVNGKTAPKPEVPFKGNIPFNQEFPTPKTTELPLVPSAKDKAMARALGLPEEKIPFEVGPYNKYQEAAYQEKGQRIKSVGDVMQYPRELTAGGFTKKQIEGMGIKDANTRAELFKLGYPKEVVAKMDAESAQGLLDNNVPYGKVPDHILNRYMKNNQDRTPRYMSEDLKNVAGASQFAAETNKPEVNAIFDKWIGERNAAKTTGMEFGAKYKEIPKDMGWSVIDSLEHPNEQAPENVKYIGGMIREQLDRIHEMAGNMGMKVGYWWDYFTHIWKESPEQIQEMIKGAGGKFKFANAREIPTYREGINLGLTPKYNHPAPVLAEYMQSLKKTEANLKLLNDLKNKGFIVDAAVGHQQPGFSPITGQGFPKSTSLGPDGEKIVGEYYAPTDIAKIINRVFGETDNGKWGTAFKYGAKASGVLQDITLSGGIPKTPINAWTFAQTTKEVLSGRIKSPIVSILRSLSGNSSNKFFEANSGQIKKMQQLGIPMETSWNLSNLMDEGFVKNAFTGIEDGAWNKTKMAWDKTVNEPTFKRFMPMLQINLFNDIERQAVKAGRSANEATQIAVNAVKNFYGLKSAGDVARRAQIGKDITGAVFFAPRYRESMITFWKNNIAAFSPVTVSKGEKWYKPWTREIGNNFNKNWWLENKTNLKFAVGATLAYGTYDMLNYSLTGRHMKDNPKGSEDKLLIPLGDGTVIGVPFLSSIATMPRMAYRVGKSLIAGDISGAAKDAAQSSVSMALKPIADIAANSNYFGQEIYNNEKDTPTEKWGKIANYVGIPTSSDMTPLVTGVYNHPYIKESVKYAQGKEPGYQAISQALESPLRFYTQDKLASNEFFDKKAEAKLAYDKFKSLVKTDQNKANEFYAQNKALIDEYPKLNDMYGMYSGLKKEGSKDDFGGVAKNLGFGLIKTPTAEANGVEAQAISTDGMSSDAQKVIQKFDIEQKKLDLLDSGKKFMRLYNRVYMVTDAGTVTSKSEDEYQSLLLGAQMTNYKKNDDVEKWFGAADKQLIKLNNQLNDQEIDEYSKIKVQNELDSLVTDYQKFKSYGGFTKPKKGAKLEEKYRYPLVDPEFIKIQSLIAGTGGRKFRMTRNALPLVRRALPVVHRTRKR